jgi:hypothetical protein
MVMYRTVLPRYSASMTSTKMSSKYVSDRSNGPSIRERGSVLRISRSDDPFLERPMLAAVYRFVIECHAKKIYLHTSSASKDRPTERYEER